MQGTHQELEQLAKKVAGAMPDFHSTGKRFAVLKAPEDTEAPEVTHVNLILNWFDEVRRRVASAGQN